MLCVFVFGGFVWGYYFVYCFFFRLFFLGGENVLGCGFAWRLFWGDCVLKLIFFATGFCWGYCLFLQGGVRGMVSLGSVHSFCPGSRDTLSIIHAGLAVRDCVLRWR